MIVDANVLLYAVDRDSAFHAPAKDWLEDSLSGSRRIGLPWTSLVAFQRIATHPRASIRPLGPAEAWSYVVEWLNAENAWLPSPGSRHAEILGALVIGQELRGNLVSDAHLAALAIEYGVGVCSFDSDFARFPDLSWTNPNRL